MRVLVAQPIPESAVKLLHEFFDVQAADHTLSMHEMIELISGADALVCSATNAVNRDVVAAADALKVISTVAVGYNNIDIEAAMEKGIAVTNTPHTLTDSVAELVFGHLLALARRIPESDRYVREGKFREWDLNLFVGFELRGKTLGIIGFGAIGQALVPIALGFGMKVLYNNRRGPVPDFREHPDVRYAEKGTVLETADVVVLLTPLESDTRHLITAREIAMMKPTSILINMGRGPLVKESDLVDALLAGRIAGACLDVYEFEPSVSKELLTMPQVLLTPHIGSATREARDRMAKRAAENVIAVLSGGICAYR